MSESLYRQWLPVEVILLVWVLPGVMVVCWQFGRQMKTLIKSTRRILRILTLFASCCNHVIEAPFSIS